MCVVYVCILLYYRPPSSPKGEGVWRLSCYEGLARFAESPAHPENETIEKTFSCNYPFLRKSAVSKKDPGGLPLHPEVKVGELDV